MLDILIELFQFLFVVWGHEWHIISLSFRKTFASFAHSQFRQYLMNIRPSVPLVTSIPMTYCKLIAITLVYLVCPWTTGISTSSEGRLQFVITLGTGEYLWFFNTTEPENICRLQNSGLKFVRVVSAKSQVVQGQMYHLNIETEHESGTKQYEAKVWVKPWENHQSLESFTPVQT